MLCATSDMMRRKGYSGIMEQWAEKESIPIYYKHTDPVSGKEFMINDETHKSVPIIKRPTLKIV
jgi:hypothetical protein